MLTWAENHEIYVTHTHWWYKSKVCITIQSALLMESTPHDNHSFIPILEVLQSVVQVREMQVMGHALFFNIGDGLFFWGVLVTNGIVILEDIGTSASDAVQCHSSATHCCTDSVTGDWSFPNSTTLPNAIMDDIYQVKGPGYLYLQRNGGGPEGIYCCAITWPDGGNPFYCFGLYSSSS